MQVAFAYHGVNSRFEIESVTAARFCLVTDSAEIVPTGAPAIRTCSPGTAKPALSNSASTLVAARSRR